jgi:hypothetical protein
MKKLLTILIILACAASAGAAVVASRVTVAATPTVILANTGTMPVAMVAVNQCASSVYVGGATVATTTGLELATGASISMVLSSGETLYGVVASSTCRVDVLKNRDQ